MKTIKILFITTLILPLIAPFLYALTPSEDYEAKIDHLMRVGYNSQKTQPSVPPSVAIHNNVESFGLELKMPKSSPGPQCTIKETGEAIKFGKGKDRVYENGRLISEVFEGTRYVYAGFDKYGKSNIQDAINIAKAGDVVIVKGGTYNYSGTYDYGITVKNGVSIYGGYSEKGKRDIVDTPTILQRNDGYLAVIKAEDITSPTVVDGFTVVGPGGSYRDGDGISIRRSTNLTLQNNTISGFAFGIFGGYGKGSVAILNNDIHHCNASIDLYGLSSVIIQNNKIHDTTGGGASGFFITGSPTGSLVIKNNIVWNAGMAILGYAGAPAIKVEDNTLFSSISMDSNNVSLKNNIFVGVANPGNSDPSNFYDPNRTLGINPPLTLVSHDPRVRDKGYRPA